MSIHAPAQPVFTSGFEGTDQEVTAAWGSSNAAAWRIADPGPFNAPGNRVLRLTVPAGVVGATMLVKTVAGSDRLFARWYMKFPAGYDFNADARHGSWFGVGNIGLAGNIPQSNSSFYYSVEPNNQGQMLIYAYYAGMRCTNPPAPGPTCWGINFQNTARPSVTVDKWFSLEIMIDAGTPTPDATGADGAFDLWVDTLHYGPWGGLWMRSVPTLQPRTLRLEIYNEPALTRDLSVLYDDLVISTQPIGPVASPVTRPIPGMNSRAGNRTITLRDGENRIRWHAGAARIELFDLQGRRRWKYEAPESGKEPDYVQPPYGLQGVFLIRFH